MLIKLLLIPILIFFQASFFNNANLDSSSSEEQILGSSEVDLETLSIDELSAPKKTTDSLGIKTTAESVIILDRTSKSMLFGKNVQERRPIASLTKIMTVLVALEDKINLDDLAMISQRAARVEPKDIKLKEGEQVKIKDLLYASLIASANDAALALAEHVGPGIGKFVKKMNKKAEDLKLQNTHFANSTGLDKEGNYSTVFDLAKLFDYALENENFRDIILTKEYTAISTNTQDTHFFRNTNGLLDSFLNIKGGKTGFTDEAGWCLVEVAENGQGNQVIAVILGSESDEMRFQETKALLDWTFRNYEWK